MFGIFVYVVMSLIGHNTYVVVDQPVGSVRLQLHPPTSVVDGVPCDPDYWGCTFDFTPVSDLKYCSQAGPAGKGASKALPCANWDSMNVASPVSEGTPFFVGTRVTETNATLVCQVPNESKGEVACKHTYEFGCDGGFAPKAGCKDYSTRDFYVADAERFTLLVDHSVRSPKVPSLHASAYQMKGLLSDCHGVANIVPHSTTEGQDYFTIGELLSTITTPDGVCGLDLDSLSSVAGSKSSVRYDGVIVELNIRYSNLKPWSGVQADISYEYHLKILKGTKSKIQEAIYKQYPTERVTRDQHGLKIVVVQTGELAVFDLTTLLVQLTTALTLLTAATTAVDLMAVWVLPYRAAYKNAKVEEVLVSRNARVKTVWIANNLETAQESVDDSKAAPPVL